mgnify:FL=1
MYFLLLSVQASAADLLVEAESFRHKGGWVTDQQFMDQMGSPYLLAHGMGIPVEDAVTQVSFPETGTYYVYVRTYNWTAPWSAKPGPGRFALYVGGQKVSSDLGTTGGDWQWQPAGRVRIKTLQTEIRLRDLTGFDGRCDALYFTQDTGQVPPSAVAEQQAFRRQIKGATAAPAVEHFDLVVVGGGVAGMSAALSAARLGSRVALVQDRPVLGGNNSSEVRVHLGARIGMEPYPQLGGLVKEFGPSRGGNAQPEDYYEDQKKLDVVLAEKNISLFLNYRAVAVETEDSQIRSVRAVHIEDGDEKVFKAPLFADCTGDGTIGYLAGADFLMGRESRDMFGESLAPEKPDSLIMGASVQWYSEETPSRTSFPVFEHGLDFNEHNCEKVTMGEWQWEVMGPNPITEAERVRDYGLMVIYSNWSFLKNRLKDNSKWRKRRLAWVAYIAGKRESRRLLGDYIVKQDDIHKQVFHEDASVTLTWSIDLHFPDSANAAKFPDAPFLTATNHLYIQPYAIPYRCLYSRNVNNLFMAGRDISVTHVAFGSARLMRTGAMMGEVVGMAASLCRKHGILPREVYQRHLGELKALMRKGVGKPGLPDNQKYNE